MLGGDALQAHRRIDLAGEAAHGVPGAQVRLLIGSASAVSVAATNRRETADLLVEAACASSPRSGRLEPAAVPTRRQARQHLLQGQQAFLRRLINRRRLF